MSRSSEAYFDPGIGALVEAWGFGPSGLSERSPSAATLAELAFPLSAITLNAIFLERTPDGSQWIGVVVLAATIVTMSIASATRKSEATGVQLPGRSPKPEPA